MALLNSSVGWGFPARLIHWLSAAVILYMLWLGFTMTDVEDVYVQFGLVQTHKSWGFIAFTLVLLRLVWRAVNPTPELPAHMSAIERLAAHGGHKALYVLMILMPLTGWLMSSASELQDSYGIKNLVALEYMVPEWLSGPIISALGWENGVLLEMPDPFVPGSKPLEEIFATVHKFSAIAMSLILLGHAVAALKHQFYNKDGLLTRMIRGG